MYSSTRQLMLVFKVRGAHGIGVTFLLTSPAFAGRGHLINAGIGTATKNAALGLERSRKNQGDNQCGCPLKYSYKPCRTAVTVVALEVETSRGPWPLLTSRHKNMAKMAAPPTAASTQKGRKRQLRPLLLTHPMSCSCANGRNLLGQT